MLMSLRSLSQQLKSKYQAGFLGSGILSLRAPKYMQAQAIVSGL